MQTELAQEHDALPRMHPSAYRAGTPKCAKCGGPPALRLGTTWHCAKHSPLRLFTGPKL